jgi:polyhydroxybutyrate depolymerase
VVFVFHGSGSSLEQMAYVTGWSAKSDDQNFLVIYPNGFPNDEGMRVWNDGRPGYDPRLDDVQFVRAMLDELDRRFSVDRKRIYVVGFSNGAGLAYRLAIELNDRIASFAAVAGRPHITVDSLRRPVSALVIVGTDDGGVAADTAAGRRFAELDHCGPAGRPLRKGRYVSINFEQCPANVAVTLYLVERWAHYWPGGRNPGVRMWAENVIWRFFEQHPMNAKN